MNSPALDPGNVVDPYFVKNSGSILCLFRLRVIIND